VETDVSAASEEALAELRAENARKWQEYVAAYRHDLESTAAETLASAVQAVEPEVGRQVAAIDKDALRGAPGLAGADAPDPWPSINVVLEAIRDETSQRLADLKDGETGAPGDKGDPGAPGKDGAPGKLVAAKAWTDGVHYEAALVTHEGALWQAQRDTGKVPGDSDDWICLAARGAPAPQFRICSTYNAESVYTELSIVALNGSSFVARKDNPGPCPGDDWQLWSQPSRPGKPGIQGERGEPGPPGAVLEPIALVVNDAGVLSLTMNDGSTHEADFYPLLDKVARR
jgi:hypothetical protein